MGFSATKKARDIIILYTLPASDLKGRDRCLYLHMFFYFLEIKKKTSGSHSITEVMVFTDSEFALALHVNAVRRCGCNGIHRF